MAENTSTQKDKKKAAREARLAKALRDNLRRRKQAVSSTEAPSDGDAEDNGKTGGIKARTRREPPKF